MKTTLVQIELEPAQLEALDRLAAERETDPDAIVQDAVRIYLDERLR
jgi:predicted transcriptional regulator